MRCNRHCSTAIVFVVFIHTLISHFCKQQVACFELYYFCSCVVSSYSHAFDARLVGLRILFTTGRGDLHAFDRKQTSDSSVG
jgi:hypothetical protein